MIDMISRQDAIDSPVKMVSEGLEWIPVYHIKELPSAQPERKKGKWIDDKCSACGYKCSACGYRVEPWNNTPYCPNCGAKMER